jgi:hypothetical protein
VNDACPADALEPSSTECRSSTGVCDPRKIAPARARPARRMPRARRSAARAPACATSRRAAMGERRLPGGWVPVELGRVPGLGRGV